MLTSRFNSLPLWLILLAFFVLPEAILFGQDVVEVKSEVKKAELVDEFGRVGECDFGGRMDSFMSELSKRPDVHGYIINYLGVETLPGNREKFSHERMIVNHISFRNFDRSRVTIVRGGFRQRIATEFWLVPPGAESPSPSRTLPEPTIPVNKTFVYETSFIYSDEIDLLDEFVLESVKRQEEEELRLADEEAVRAEEEARKDQPDEAEVKPNEKGGEEKSDPTVAEAPVDEVDEMEETDRLTPEEEEEARFSWIDGKFWPFLLQRRNDSAVIIFYAHDKRYDIGRLQAFVAEARNKITSLAGIRPARVRIMFGGYRDRPEAEFWVIPPKGKRPIPTPDVRPEPEPKSDDN